jgi:hypothetical protein
MGKRRYKKHLPAFFDPIDNPELHRFPNGRPVDFSSASNFIAIGIPADRIA